MSNCVLSKLEARIYLLLFAAGLALAPPSRGQTGSATIQTPSKPASASYVPTMTFEVASVRENKNVDPVAGITVSGSFVPHTTVLRLINWRIESLIGYAYGANESQILGAPKWPWPTIFVIEAKGDREADAKLAALTADQQSAEQQHMLQALLEERFNLKTHWETKEGDVYYLVVSKGGPKLSTEGRMPPSEQELKNFGERPVPTLYQRNYGQGYEFIAHGCPMDQLVAMLASQFGRPVIDRTELTGKFDFVLQYKGRWDQDRPADDLDPQPPMDRALLEQLGLKVQPAKGPVKVLVIDHIDKPSAN